MRRLIVAALTLMVAFTAGTGVVATAQEGDSPTLSWVAYLRPTRGMQGELEEALKRHAAWHAENAPGPGYAVGQVMTGSRAGQYLFLWSGLHWSDLDGLDSDVSRADEANWTATIGKFSTQTANMVSRPLPDLSRAGEGPVAAVRLTRFRIKQGMAGQFRSALSKLHEGRKEDPTRYTWSVTVAGADAPSFTSAVLEDSWSGFEPDDSFSLADAMGQEEVAAAWQELIECVESRQTNLLRVRPDLAYAGEE